MDNNNDHQNNSYDDNFYSNFNDSSKNELNSSLDNYNASLSNNSNSINPNNDEGKNNETKSNDNLNNNVVINNNESKQKGFKHRSTFFKFMFCIMFISVISIVTILVLAELKLIKLPWVEYPEILNLSQNELILKKDTKFQFSTYVYPSQVKYGKVIFESSNPDIAEINPITGYVDAKQNGVTTIKAYLEDYRDIYDTCDLVVSNNNVIVERMEVEHSNIDILVGNKYLLKYSYYPKNAGLHYFSYTSSDPSIITINNKGEVQAVKPGKAVINIIEEVSGQVVHQEFTVYAKNNAKNSGNFIVSNLKLSENDISLNVGGEYQVDAVVYPLDVSQSVSWTSLDESVVTVSQEGLIKAIDYGDTKVLATAIDGTNKIISVKVQEDRLPIKSIKFNEKRISIQRDESKKINIIIEPQNATDRKIEWTSSNELIATVDESGIVTGLMKGTTLIKASTPDNISEVIIVDVIQPSSNIPVNNLFISKTNVKIQDGSSVNIDTTITPSNATNKKLTWSSSNNKVATVSNGMIYGKSPGSAIITVQTSNNISKIINVTVTPIIVNSITLNQTNVKLGVGGDVKLYATFKPANASDKRIVWLSSNSAIASVDSSGLVKANKIGKVTIIARTPNGQIAQCQVTITNESIPVTKLQLSSNKYIVKVGEKVGITPIISPSNATNQKVSLKVNNTSLASVQSDGTIKGIKEGIVELTATSNNGKIAKAYVIVKNKNASVNYLDGSTIKYWYDSTYGTYAVTHIWVKDAYNQFKMEIPDKFGTLANPNSLTQKAAKKNAGKTLISINASGFVTESFSRQLYQTKKEWKNTSVSPIVIYESRLIRDYTTMNLPGTSYRIFAMNKNGLLVYYTFSTDKTQNGGLANRILQDGVKYTFGWTPVLIYNGEVQSSLSKQTSIRQSICQIDKNNFLYITNISSNRAKGFSPYSLANKMKDLGCINGFNLDGGGSASVYYVKKGNTIPTKLRVSEGSYGRSIPDIIYFVGN